MRIWAILLFLGCVCGSCSMGSRHKEALHQYIGKNLMLNYDTPKIEVDKVLLEKENGDTICLSEVSNLSGKLVFVYSQINCLTCVETVLKVIPDEFPQLMDKLMVVSSYESLRNLYVFKRVNKYEGEIYNDFSGDLVNSFNAGHLPALFFLQPDGKVYNFLWADKSQIAVLKKYLQKMEKQLKES